MIDKLLNLKESATYVGVTRKTIYNDMEKGLIQATQRSEKEVLFSKGALDSYKVKKGKAPISRKIISIINHKGGVGKSSLVIHLAHYLSENGYKVLILDNDPQGNVSTYFLNNRQRKNLMSKVYEKEAIESFMIDKTDYSNIDIISSDTDLAEIEWKVKNKRFSDQSLERAMGKSKDLLDTYQFILIDNKPDLGTFPFNAMVASDGVLVPTEAKPFSIDGVKAIKENVDFAKAILLGIVINFYRKNTNESQKTKAFYKENYPNDLFETILPLSVNLSLGDLNEELEYQRKESAYLSGNKEAKKVIDAFGSEFLKRIQQKLS